MAKQTEAKFSKKTPKPRPGVHAKSKSSKIKASKLYSKRYKGQGK